MLQLIYHLVGDYLTQSDWMAQNKTRATWPAFCHATVYGLPFLLIGSPAAVLVIWATHLIIDRFRLARYVVWLKNHLAPVRTLEKRTLKVFSETGEPRSTVTFHDQKRWWHPWSVCTATGYHKDTPAWLAVWLMIVADNTLHLAINYAALRWL